MFVPFRRCDKFFKLSSKQLDYQTISKKIKRNCRRKTRRRPNGDFYTCCYQIFALPSIITNERDHSLLLSLDFKVFRISIHNNKQQLASFKILVKNISHHLHKKAKSFLLLNQTSDVRALPIKSTSRNNSENNFNIDCGDKTGTSIALKMFYVS